MRSFRSLLALILLTACSSPTQPVDSWRVQLTSTGGIHARGGGDYTVDSGGAITVKTIAGNQCSFTATADDLARFNALVAAAKPRNWKTSYVPSNPCCDRIEWTLTLTAEASRFTTKWIDDPLPMPADLTALADAVRGLSAKGCGNQ